MDSDELKKGDLRKKAEKLLTNTDNNATISTEITELIHELQVHEIELEIQNQELRDSQLKLEESRTKYLELYDFAPIGYLTLNDHGTITEINHAGASLLGSSRNNLINTTFLLFLTSKSRIKFNKYMKNFNESRIDDGCDLKLKGNHDKPYDIHIKKSCINGIVPTFMIAMMDISKTKETEKKLEDYQDSLEEMVRNRTMELEKSNNDLKNFAYVASHDLKEPLRMISSFLQLLERRYNDKLDDDANEFIGYAVDGAQRLNDMINDLLEYSKLSKYIPDFKYLNVENVLDDVLINLNLSIMETHAIITRNPLPNICADEKLIFQLFQNLISNSIKYHGQKCPNMHISARKTDDEYIFSIRDMGIGIKKDYQKRIFTIFQRLHGKDEYEGTGIGLAISKKIVQQHFGSIWVESEPGKGSTFYFSLPFTQKIV